ncbi:MAG: hypothetical protein Kow0049_23280 [Stanieria sp.]|jgi:hypothetical protein
MLQLPGFWLTFLYYFAVTNLIVAITVSQGMGLSWQDKSIYQLGVLLGLIAGLLGAKFNRNITINKAFKNDKTLIKTLNKSLAEMGFQAKSELDDFTVYQKSKISSIFAGKVFVKIDKNLKCVTIVGRASIIEKLNQILDN